MSKTIRQLNITRLILHGHPLKRRYSFPNHAGTYQRQHLATNATNKIPIAEVTLEDVLAPDNVILDMLQRTKSPLTLEQVKTISNVLLESQIKKKEPISKIKVQLSSILDSKEKVSTLRAIGGLSLKSCRYGILALDLYKLGMENGDEDAAFEYARILNSGAKGIQPVPTIAMKILSDLASRNHIPSLLTLGNALSKSNTVYAMKLLKRAANLNSSEAYLILGRLNNDIESFRKAAKMGNSFAHFYLAQHEKDKEKSFFHLEQAAKTGIIPEAAHNLALIYLNRGDPFSSRQWFIVASEQNFVPSMMNLADMFTTGKGGKSDPQGAIDLYQRVIQLLSKSNISSKEILNEANDKLAKLKEIHSDLTTSRSTTSCIIM